MCSTTSKLHTPQSFVGGGKNHFTYSLILVKEITLSEKYLILAKDCEQPRGIEAYLAPPGWSN